MGSGSATELEGFDDITLSPVADNPLIADGHGPKVRLAVPTTTMTCRVDRNGTAIVHGIWM